MKALTYEAAFFFSDAM